MALNWDLKELTNTFQPNSFPHYLVQRIINYHIKRQNAQTTNAANIKAPFTLHSIYWHGTAKISTRTQFYSCSGYQYKCRARMKWARVPILAVPCR